MSVYAKEAGEDWVEGSRGPTQSLDYMRVYASYAAVVGGVTAAVGGEFVVEEADETRFPIRDNYHSMDQAPDHES